MSSIEAAEAAKVNGFQKQVLPLPVVEIELLLLYNYYCNNFSAFRRYACFRNTSKNASWKKGVGLKIFDDDSELVGGVIKAD